MVRVLLSLALCIPALALPARAADLATLGCVAGKLPLLAKAQVEIDVERNLRETGKRPRYDPRLIAALRAATAACAREHGWPEAALQPAALYTRAKLGWSVAQRVAIERGLDPAILETVWLTLPEDERNLPLSVADYRRLADAAVPEGESRTAENGEFVSEFFQMLSVMQYSSYEFAQAGEPAPDAAAPEEDAPAPEEAAPEAAAPAVDEVVPDAPAPEEAVPEAAAPAVDEALPDAPAPEEAAAPGR